MFSGCEHCVHECACTVHLCACVKTCRVDLLPRFEVRVRCSRSALYFLFQCTSVQMSGLIDFILKKKKTPHTHTSTHLDTATPMYAHRILRCTLDKLNSAINMCETASAWQVRYDVTAMSVRVRANMPHDEWTAWVGKVFAC